MIKGGTFTNSKEWCYHKFGRFTKSQMMLRWRLLLRQNKSRESQHRSLCVMVVGEDRSLLSQLPKGKEKSPGDGKKVLSLRGYFTNKVTDPDPFTCQPWTRL